MKTLILFFIFLFSFSTFSLAQQPPSPEAMQKQIEESQKFLEEQRKVYLEQLKQQDPAAYEQIKKAELLAEKISKIVSSYRANSISQEEAERQLYPLVEESLKDRLKAIDSEIERLQKRLSYLKEVKRDPSIMVREQIKQLLGEGMLTPPEIY